MIFHASITINIETNGFTWDTLVVIIQTMLWRCLYISSVIIKPNMLMAASRMPVLDIDVEVGNSSSEYLCNCMNTVTCHLYSIYLNLSVAISKIIVYDFQPAFYFPGSMLLHGKKIRDLP
ncbi:uncharacterized protein CANTADRAFT_334483 [Suhomyces tanzawaensis NRRL Y-17324]|uniref:Uncharacterized protein n=1 Tax=Suhomyces tanzawaensis NRRL Y-17324 TaxID=984487 RepID=A0A1E4SBI8_9ASCO|nr:uncharacterized protein CANTADRAFT_334483 [Suhomyces tanzawaensis NRRL Y-17324]ODV76838.1 hypothetical protein CANTADRAFT_334483 [Suhomyces tanzawaensis NRRL Y-17324]